MDAAAAATAPVTDSCMNCLLDVISVTSESIAGQDPVPANRDGSGIFISSAQNVRDSVSAADMDESAHAWAFSGSDPERLGQNNEWHPLRRVINRCLRVNCMRM